MGALRSSTPSSTRGAIVAGRPVALHSAVGDRGGEVARRPAALVAQSANREAVGAHEARVFVHDACGSLRRTVAPERDAGGALLRPPGHSPRLRLLAKEVGGWESRCASRPCCVRWLAVAPNSRRLPGSCATCSTPSGASPPNSLSRVLAEEGSLRRHVNVFVNEEDVRFRELLDTPVREGDCVTIVPSIAGGR